MEVYGKTITGLGPDSADGCTLIYRSHAPKRSTLVGISHYYQWDQSVFALREGMLGGMFHVLFKF